MPLRKRSQAQEVLRRVIAFPIGLSVASGMVTICVSRDLRGFWSGIKSQFLPSQITCNPFESSTHTITLE